MLMLLNPTGSARSQRRKASTTKRRHTNMARKRKRSHNKKRRRRNPGLVAPFAGNPRRRRRGRSHNPKYRRRRRNPGFGVSPRGIFGMVTQGLTDSLGIVSGKV